MVMDKIDVKMYKHQSVIHHEWSDYKETCKIAVGNQFKQNNYMWTAEGLFEQKDKFWEKKIFFRRMIWHTIPVLYLQQLWIALPFHSTKPMEQYPCLSYDTTFHMENGNWLVHHSVCLYKVVSVMATLYLIPCYQLKDSTTECQLAYSRIWKMLFWNRILPDYTEYNVDQIILQHWQVETRSTFPWFDQRWKQSNHVFFAVHITTFLWLFTWNRDGFEENEFTQSSRYTRVWLGSGYDYWAYRRFSADCSNV